MGGRGSSSSMGGGMGAGGGAGIAATQQQPQNAPPFAVPQSIKINAGNIITPAAVQQQQPPQPQQPPIAQAPTPTNTPVQPDALSALTKMSDDQLTGYGRLRRRRFLTI